MTLSTVFLSNKCGISEYKRHLKILPSVYFVILLEYFLFILILFPSFLCRV